MTRAIIYLTVAFAAGAPCDLDVHSAQSGHRRQRRRRGTGYAHGALQQ